MQRILANIRAYIDAQPRTFLGQTRPQWAILSCMAWATALAIYLKPTATTTVFLACTAFFSATAIMPWPASHVQEDQPGVPAKDRNHQRT